MRENGIPGSDDSVQRAFRALQKLGIATLRQAHIHAGVVRLAAQWHFDFRPWLPGELWASPLPQFAALPEDLAKPHSSQEFNSRTSKQQPQFARLAAADLASQALKSAWEVLRAEGARPYAWSKLFECGLTPDDAETVVRAAILEAKHLGKDNPAAYALKALSTPDMGDRLLRSLRSKNTQLPTPALTHRMEAISAAETVPGLSVEQATEDLSRMSVALKGFDLAVVVEAATERVRHHSVSRPDRLFGWLLTSCPVDFLSEIRRKMRYGEGHTDGVSGKTIKKITAWEGVVEPLASNPRARKTFELLARLNESKPSSDSPGFLDHCEAVSRARRELVALAEAAFGSAQDLREDLRNRLSEAGIQEGSLAWRSVWEYHWSQIVLGKVGLSCCL